MLDRHQPRQPKRVLLDPGRLLPTALYAQVGSADKKRKRRQQNKQDEPGPQPKTRPGANSQQFPHCGAIDLVS
jgi:hypothetical protein